MPAVGFALLLWAAAGGGAAAEPSAPRCSGIDVAVDGDFEQAGFAACDVSGGGAVTLTIRPETRPINPSPWYAARLTQTVNRARVVRLDYDGAKHRYRPWWSVNGGPWQLVESRTEEGGQVSIELPAFTGTATLAAQPLRPLAGVQAQWQARVDTGELTLELTAQSGDGRPVPLYRLGPADSAHIHVFTARQHPPETTGAAAFDAFADALLARRPAQLCPGHAFLFAPIMNPDGIVRGHWRTNAGRVDLNRDWGRFGEPETAAVGGAIISAAQTARLHSILDFHSTRSDALYAPKGGQGNAAAFAAAVARDTGLRPVPTHNSDGATLKSWGEQQFGAAAFTVELADAHNPESAAAIGTRIADNFLDHLACPVSAE